MLSLYLNYERKTKNTVVFMGEDGKAIFHIPKESWVVMGRPTTIVVEVTPEDDE